MTEMRTRGLLGYRASEATENEPPDLPGASVGKLKLYEIDGKHVTVQTQDGMGFGMPLHDFMPTPKPGAEVVVWPGFGGRFRLVIIDGYVHQYITEDELRIANEAAIEAHEQRRREELEANRETQAAREAALIPELAGRCEALRQRSELGPEGWNAHYWPYDLFVCEEAQKIIGAVRGGLLDLDALHAGEVREYPGMDDGHSGNTFGASVFLADLVLTASDAETAAISACAMPGALAPLMGSKETG